MRDVSYMVEFLNKRDAQIGEEEVFIRDNMLKLLDSVRTRIMYDPDLLHDCTGLHIQTIDG